jgi:hypothetical protein
MTDPLNLREIFMTGPFTNRQLQKCAEREVALRKAVYAKRGMTLGRLAEIEMMEAIAAHFKRLSDGEEKVQSEIAPDGQSGS